MAAERGAWTARLSLRPGDNLGLKVLSLVLALMGWLLARGEQTYQEVVVVPVDYLLPTDLVLLNGTTLPERVVIQVSGSKAALGGMKNQLREGAIQYLVDLEDAEPGRAVHSFRLPPLGMSSVVTLQTVSPAEVELQFDALAKRTLPVQLSVRGSLPTGYVLQSRDIEPGFVTLMGARSELADLQAIPTVPVQLSTRRSSVDQTIALDLSGMHMHPDSATSVQVRLDILEQAGDLQLAEIPVVVADQQRFKVNPSVCTVTLFGPQPVLAELGAESVRGEVVARLDTEEDRRVAASELIWDPARVSDAQPGIVIRIDHARAGEVVVKAVEPAAFAVELLAPPVADGAGAQEGKED